MGGNLIGCERIPAEKYFKLKAKLLKLLQESECFEEFCVPRENPSKMDYGDIDVLVVKIEGKEFEPKDASIVSRRPGMLSFDLEKFQVDLISTPKDTLPCAMFFYSYGDFGMLLGMMIRPYNLRFGADGFFLKEEGKEIFLTRDPKAIMKFLGFDAERYSTGFTTESQVFDFLKTCRFYRGGGSFKSAFVKRDGRKLERPMFKRFVDLLNESLMQPKASQEQIDSVRDEVLLYFDKIVEYRECHELHERRRAVKQKFNGKLVSEWTGLKDKELGDFMKKIRADISDEELYDKEAVEIETLVKSKLL